MQPPSSTNRIHRLRCPHCGTMVSIPSTLVGQVAECAHCDHRFKVEAKVAEPSHTSNTMTIQATCPGCNRLLEASDRKAGKTISCPHCATQFVFPSASTPITSTAMTAPVITQPPPMSNALCCPRCGDKDVRSFSIVWGQGTSTSSGTSVGIGGLTGGFLSPSRAMAVAAGVSQSRKSNATMLAKQCEPPKQKSTVGPVVAILFGGMMLLGSIAGMADPQLAQHGRQSEHAMSFVIGLIIGPIAGLLGILAYSNATTFNRVEYPRLLKAWQSTLICLRCGNQFTI